MPKKSLSFSKALPYSSRDNRASFSVSINDLKCVPSRRRSSTLSFDYLSTGRRPETFLEFTSFLARTQIIKTLILLPKPLERMAQTFFRLPQRLIKKYFMTCSTSFLGKLLRPSRHIFGDEKTFLCGFFPPSSFPSRYSHSQLTLISRKAFCRGNNLMGIFHLVNRQPATISSLVASAHKKSHQLCEMACFCCFITFRVFMLPVTQ